MSETLTKIARLAKRMIVAKQNGSRPFVLVLGSGVMPLRAMEIGLITAQDGIDDETRERLEKNPAKRRAAFERACHGLGADDEDRATPLRPYFARKADAPPDGYDALARLIHHGYFPLILTADISDRLEDALVRAGMVKSRWATYSLFRYSVEDLERALPREKPEVKIVRLAGELNDAFALLPDEIRHVGEKYTPVLERYLAQDLLLVGFEPERDDHLFAKGRRGRTLHYVGREPAAGSNLIAAMEARRSDDEKYQMTGEDAAFDAFFGSLTSHLLGGERSDEVGLETLARAGVNVDDMPDVSLEEALLRKNMSGLRSSPNPLVDLCLPTTTLCITCDGDLRVSFRIEGVLNSQSEAGKPVRLRLPVLKRTLFDLGEELRERRTAGALTRWRNRVAELGERVFEDVFEDNSDLKQTLYLARQTAGDDESLILAFAGPRQHLGLPFELLHDNEGPLAVRHPICRQVTDVSGREPQRFLDFLTTLRPKGEPSKGEPLRVLLLASDTGAAERLQADEEVKTLEEVIRRESDLRKIRVEVEALPTARADYATVERLLTNCRFHVVHYAGHCRYDPERPEQSCLLFWDRGGAGRREVALTALALNGMLTRSETRLLYLNSCVGAVVGDGEFAHQDCKGVMDAVVKAGVPAVLGYRWEVTDDGARAFAERFYQALFETHCPAKAALRARQTLYRRNAEDETWTAPVLVVQKP